MSTCSFQAFNSIWDFLFHSSGAFQSPRAADNSFKEALASPTTAWAKCLFASNLETLIETSLKFSFSKLVHEPVVKSASLVPTAIARSVCFASEFVFFPPSAPICPA